MLLSNLPKSAQQPIEGGRRGNGVASVPFLYLTNLAVHLETSLFGYNAGKQP